MFGSLKKKLRESLEKVSSVISKKEAPSKISVVVEEEKPKKKSGQKKHLRQRKRSLRNTRKQTKNSGIGKRLK